MSGLTVGAEAAAAAQNPPPPGEIAELYALWSIQDALLQNYRMLFITVQSILLSIAVAVTAEGAPLLAFVIAIPGVFVMTKWTTFTRIRSECVNIAKRMIKRAEAGAPVIAPLAAFEAEQNQIKLKDLKPNRKQQTRHWMEVQLPGMFALSWVFLLGTCATMVFLRTRWAAPVREMIDTMLAYMAA